MKQMMRWTSLGLLVLAGFCGCASTSPEEAAVGPVYLAPEEGESPLAIMVCVKDGETHEGFAKAFEQALVVKLNAAIDQVPLFKRIETENIDDLDKFLLVEVRYMSNLDFTRSMGIFDMGVALMVHDAKTQRVEIAEMHRARIELTDEAAFADSFPSFGRMHSVRPELTAELEKKVTEAQFEEAAQEVADAFLKHFVRE